MDNVKLVDLSEYPLANALYISDDMYSDMARLLDVDREEAKITCMAIYLRITKEQ